MSKGSWAQIPVQAALIFLLSVSPAAAEVECAVEFVDDLGAPIEEALKVCRVGAAADECVEWRPGSGGPAVGKTAEYLVEGDGHGPSKVRLAPGEIELCSVTVVRKATVSIDFDPKKTRQLPTSLYRTDLDSKLYRPQERFSLDSPAKLRVPPGDYLVSLTERGWAPDLHLLTAGPGSVHQLEHRRLGGWSVVIRAAADSNSQPISGAEISLRTIPGFDSPATKQRPRTLVEKRSDGGGWVAFSGLAVSLAGAVVSHPEYLKTEIPAFSSETGTFRVFEARLQQGGKLVVRTGGLDKADAETVHRKVECGLFSPDTSDEWEFEDSFKLVTMQTDGEGTCRASRIPGGSYALKVSIPGKDDAYTVEPVFIVDGQTTLTTVELRPIRISGRVYRGTEGAPGYEVVFGRAEEFPAGGPVFPVGKPAQTDEDGDYELVLWSAGRYLAMVSNSTSIAGLPRVVDIQDDDSLDFEVSSLAIEGRVIDDRGSPRPEAKVRVRLGGLTRNVLLDEDGRFEVPFDSESEGTAELIASAAGFLDSVPLRVEVRAGAVLDQVELQLRSREWRTGRLVLSSGLPAAGAWVAVHRLGSPLQYIPTVERAVADAGGKVEVPREADRLRLFFGGAGCPLGFYDLAPVQDSAEPGQLEGNGEFLITCGEPGHLIVRLVAEEPELKDRVPIILRKDGVTIPDAVLENHLAGLGLPTVTDGHGRLGLVALEPGGYELFHGKMTSSLNVAAHADMALLSRVHLDARATVELEAVVDLR